MALASPDACMAVAEQQPGSPRARTLWCRRVGPPLPQDQRLHGPLPQAGRCAGVPCTLGAPCKVAAAASAAAAALKASEAARRSLATCAMHSAAASVQPAACTFVTHKVWSRLQGLAGSPAGPELRSCNAVTTVPAQPSPAARAGSGLPAAAHSRWPGASTTCHAGPAAQSGFSAKGTISRPPRRRNSRARAPAIARSAYLLPQAYISGSSSEPMVRLHHDAPDVGHGHPSRVGQPALQRLRWQHSAHTIAGGRLKLKWELMQCACEPIHDTCMHDGVMHAQRAGAHALPADAAWQMHLFPTQRC